MENLQLITEALQKAVQMSVFNKLELKAIQISLEELSKQLQPQEEEEVKPKLEKSK
jgi:hypothetical protein